MNNVAAVAAAKPLPQPTIEFRAKVSKMGPRRVICVPAYLYSHLNRLNGKELKIQILES